MTNTTTYSASHRSDTKFKLNLAFLSSIIMLRIYVVFIVLVTWEVAARFFIDPLFSAPPSEVVLNIPSLLSTPGMLKALVITIGELSLAFALSILIGLAAGLAVGSSCFSRRTFFPPMMLLYGVPQITILPLVVLIFGIGPASKVVFGVTHGVFPIFIATVASMRNIKPILVTAPRSMGASRWQVFRHVTLMHMIPGFFSGLRISMAAVTIGVLLAELYASAEGIGYFTSLFADSFDQKNLLGLVIVISLMAILMNSLLRRVETFFTRWKN